MRINERQERLVNSTPKEWLEIMTNGCHAGKATEDRLTDNSYRFIAKDSKGIAHGNWLIHSVHIDLANKQAWACVSDNVEYIARRAQEKRDLQLGIDKRKILKPALELVSSWGQALFSYHTENKVTGTQFELLLQAYDLWCDVHMQTKSFIRNNLNWISDKSYSCINSKGSSKVFGHFRALQNRINGLLELELEELDQINNPDRYVSDEMLAGLFGNRLAA